MLVSIFLIVCLHFVRINGECPNINDLPVLNSAGDEFYCAWHWRNWGADEPIRGCNGPEFYHMDHYDDDEPEGKMMPMGSIIVKAGCKHWSFQKHNWQI